MNTGAARLKDQGRSKAADEMRRVNPLYAQETITGTTVLDVPYLRLGSTCGVGLEMNDNLPSTELPERATGPEHLAETIAVARELVELRVGYPVELARLEPIERNGCMNMRAHWRRKLPRLRLAM
jgi:hypothetical protein